MNEEHLQPVQSLTPDERSRARRLAVTMVPAIVLIAVIGAAIFGGGRSADDRSNPERTGSHRGRTGGRGKPSPRMSRRSGLPASRRARSASRCTRWPGRWRFATTARSRTAVVAVAGWLTCRPSPTAAWTWSVERGGPYGNRRRLPAIDGAGRRCRARRSVPGRQAARPPRCRTSARSCSPHWLAGRVAGAGSRPSQVAPDM